MRYNQFVKNQINLDTDYLFSIIILAGKRAIHGSYKTYNYKNLTYNACVVNYPMKSVLHNYIQLLIYS